MPKLKSLNLNHSSYKEFRTCPMRFKLGTVEGFTGFSKLEDIIAGLDPEKPLSATGFGTLLHELLDRHFREVCSPWEDLGLPGPPSGSKWAARSLTHLKLVFDAYREHNPLGDFKLLASEQNLQLKVSDWLTLNGTLDKIIEQDGKLWVVDHKTSSGIDRFLKPSIRTTQQFPLYVLLARANGYDVEGLIIDGISTLKKDLGSPDNLFFTDRQIYCVDELDATLERFRSTAEDIKHCIETDIWPDQLDIACNNYGSTCLFIDFCTAHNNENKRDWLVNQEPQEKDSSRFDFVLDTD